MPKRIMIWNIQNFGMKHRDDELGLWVRHVLMLCAIVDANADVVLIQEARKECAGALLNLCEDLRRLTDREWSFDYIPAALIANRPIPILAELGWTTRANMEGYAVLCKHNEDGTRPVNNIVGAPSFGRANANFEIKQSGPDNMINVVTLGFRPRFNFPNYIEIDFDWGNGIQNGTVLGFPYSLSRAVTASNENDAILFAERVRRPCYVVVRNDAGINVFVTCYHAPSKSPGALQGTLVAFGSSSMDTVHPNRLGGDFNLVQESSLRSLLLRQEGLGYRGTLRRGADNLPSSPGTTVHSVTRNHQWRNRDNPNPSSVRDFGLIPNLVFIADPEVYVLHGRALEDMEYYLEHQEHNENSVYSRILVHLCSEELDDLLENMLDTNFFNDVVAEGASRRQVIEAFADEINQPTMQTEYPGTSDRMTAILIIFEYFLSDHKPILLAV